MRQRLSHYTCLQFILLTAVMAPPDNLAAQLEHQLKAGTHPPAVLIELFTSEGCSDCPPADELLRQVNGRTTAEGQFIVGISEHVTYWNGHGLEDPYSSDAYTNRQNAYSARFKLDSVYTPQMVVNGRVQFVGSNRRALQSALEREAKREQIALHIDSARLTGSSVTFSYTAANLPVNSSLQLFAVLVDDVDQSHVWRGENSGRDLTHVAVARKLAHLGTLKNSQQRSVKLRLPPSFLSGAGTGHHLIVFAQQRGVGGVEGIDMVSL